VCHTCTLLPDSRRNLPISCLITFLFRPPPSWMSVHPSSRDPAYAMFSIRARSLNSSVSLFPQQRKNAWVQCSPFSILMIFNVSRTQLLRLARTWAGLLRFPLVSFPIFPPSLFFFLPTGLGLPLPRRIEFSSFPIQRAFSPLFHMNVATPLTTLHGRHRSAFAPHPLRFPPPSFYLGSNQNRSQSIWSPQSSSSSRTPPDRIENGNNRLCPPPCPLLLFFVLLEPAR